MARSPCDATRPFKIESPTFNYKRSRQNESINDSIEVRKL